MPLISISEVTSTVNGLTLIVVWSLYSDPSSITCVSVTCPKLLIVTSIIASLPVPLITTFGADLYPRPGLSILTLASLPLTIIGVNCALSILLVLIYSNSSMLSTLRSHSCETDVGMSSFFNKFVRLYSSVIKFCFNTKLIRSIVCFNASILLTNILWRGLDCIPYRILNGILGSGIALSAISKPIKLSNHLRSKSCSGTLSGEPSANNLYWLW